MSELKSFLLEIGTEEMPYWAVLNGIDYLRKSFEKTFVESGLEFKDLRVLGTPRRFAVLCRVSERQADRKISVRGPAFAQAFDSEGKPTKAAEGFARSQGVTTDDLVVKQANGGMYVFVEKEIAGELTKDFLQKEIPEIVRKMSFKKSMKWGSGNFRFVRPIRWIVALLSDEVVDFEIAGVKSGRTTLGHRFLSRGEISLLNPDEYEERLRNEGKVIVDQDERKQIILRDSEKESLVFGGRPEIDSEVLSEVVFLVENPQVIVGNFNPDYLKLPDEVLTTVMQVHQRYFPIKGPDGNLINKFIVVHNGDPQYAEIIREGNERVIAARLEDARFFFEEDLKVKLDDLVPKLRSVVFQKKLGSLYEKTERNTRLAEFISDMLKLPEDAKNTALRAAYLLKADLLTHMVNEFDELQGVMGREYAAHQGEPEEVAAAIYEHYLPKFFGDKIPETAAGRVCAIADKIDTVSGYFLAGLEPTGSEDPYSLRRQAQGICQIIYEAEIDLNLLELINFALGQYASIDGLKSSKEVSERLKEFFEARISRILSEFGYEDREIQSVVENFLIRPVEAKRKLQVLHKLKDTPYFEDLLTAYQRVKNLSKPDLGSDYAPENFVEQAEKNLDVAFKDAKENWEAISLEERVYKLSELRKPIDTFFDTVLVMHEDLKIRENRLKLLNAVLELYHSFADFSAFL